MKNLTFEELEKAHKANHMFYVGTLSTGHIVFARIENTNFFEGEPDYTKKRGFKEERLTQLKVKEMKELGFVPTRNCEPSERARVKFKDFYENRLIMELTDRKEEAVLIVFDSEFYQQYRVYDKGRMVYESFEQNEAKEFLRNSSYKTVQNYEIMTSMACTLYMQGSFCTFNIISPLEKINTKCSYEEMPKIDMEEWLSFLFTTCGIDCAVYSNKTIDEGKMNAKSKCLHVALIAHNGRAEWNKFKWFNTREFDSKGKLKDECGQPVMNYISNIQGGNITVKKFRALLKRTKGKQQNIEFFIGDTMALVDADHKKLEYIGKLTAMGSQTEKEYVSKYHITHMNKFLTEDPEGYIRYSIQDTIVPLVFIANLYGVNATPDITLLTGGQRVSIAQLCNLYLQEASHYTNMVLSRMKKLGLKDKNGRPIQFLNNDTLTKEGYDLVYRGLIPEHKNTQNTELPLYEKDGLIAVNEAMRDLLLMAQRGYSGGENFSAYVSVPADPRTVADISASKRPKTKRKPKRSSVFEGKLAQHELFYDLDIQSAYPTSMYPIVAVNVLDPIAYISNEEIEFDATTKQGKQKFRNFKKAIVKEINRKNVGNGKISSLDLGIPGFVEVKYCVTPKGRPLLSAKLRGENVPVNPIIFEASGDAQRSCTFTFLELQQCIDMGCDIVVSKVVITNPVFTDKGKLFRPLGEAIVQIIQLRKQMAKKYGKKSLPALICKLIANGVYYGKTAQNCIPTKTYSPIDNEGESIDRGPSRMTQPIYASYITAGTRCILSCAGFEMYKKGFVGWLSQTTDGGISTVPEFLVNMWCSATTMGKFFKGVRAELSQKTEGKVDDRLFATKHISQELYNFTTRGNVGFCYDKEIQVPVGYVNPHDTSRGFKYETFYVSHLLSETERKEIIETVGEDYIIDGVCAMQGFRSEFEYQKGSEEFKQEIVQSYMRGDRREQINTYKPESLTQKQRAQIVKDKSEEREFPMSTMQKNSLKMNFDYKTIPHPEDFDEVEISGMKYMVGWTQPPKTFEEAMSYRKVVKNMKRCVRNVADLEEIEKRANTYKPLTKKQMGQLIKAHTLCLVTVYKFNELGWEDRLEFINDYIKDEEMTMDEMQYHFKTRYAEKQKETVKNMCYKNIFDETVKSMNEVGED